MTIKTKEVRELIDLGDFEQIQEKINASAEQIAKINNALGLGKTVIKADGVYRIFNNGTDILIVSGDFTRKKLTNRHFKIS